MHSKTTGSRFNLPHITKKTFFKITNAKSKTETDEHKKPEKAQSDRERQSSRYQLGTSNATMPEDSVRASAVRRIVEDADKYHYIYK